MLSTMLKGAIRVRILVLAVVMAVGFVLGSDWLDTRTAEARGGGRGGGGFHAPRGNISPSPGRSRGPGPGSGPHGPSVVPPPPGKGGFAGRDHAGAPPAIAPRGNISAPPPGYHPPVPPGPHPPEPRPTPPPPPGPRPPGQPPIPPPPPPGPPGPHPFPPPPPPFPVPPPPYGGYYPGVATGMAIAAMLTILPATAIAITNPTTGSIIYQDGTTCYVESYQGGTKVYLPVTCP